MTTGELKTADVEVFSRLCYDGCKSKVENVFLILAVKEVKKFALPSPNTKVPLSKALQCLLYQEVLLIV